MNIQGLINKIFKANQTQTNTVSWSGSNGLKTIQEDIVETIRERTFFTVPTTADLINQGFNNAILCYVQDHAFFRWYATGIPNGTTIFPANDGGVWVQETIGQTDGTVTSIGITAPSAFTVTGSPVTTSGVIDIAANGTASEYIKGDGTLGTFPSSSGTVTNVSALTIDTLGTDLSSTVANPTTTPIITLSVPTASATNRGALSPTDWTTFNNKQNAITNPVSGTGTSNYVSKWFNTNTLTDGLIYDNGTYAGIGTTNPLAKFHIKVPANNPQRGILCLETTNSGANPFQSFWSNNAWVGYIDVHQNYFNIQSVTNGLINLNPSGGNVTVGSVTNNGYKFDVLGTGRYTGSLFVDNQNFYAGTTSINSSLSYGFQVLMNSNTYGNTLTHCQAALLYTFANPQSSAYGSYPGQTNGFSSSQSLAFVTGSTEKMRITLSGNVLIGTTTDAGFQLDINGNGRIYGQLTVGAPFNTGIINFASSGTTVLSSITQTTTVTNFTHNQGSGYNFYVVGGSSVPKIFFRSSGVGISGLNGPSFTLNASAALEINTTTQGFLLPRMTDTQILAIASPANGLMVYSTTQNVIAFYDGTGWHKVTHTNL